MKSQENKFAFSPKKSADQRFLWKYRLEISEKMLVDREGNMQLLENFPPVGDMLLCLYKYLYNLNKLGKRHKHK